jgi:alginate O-acetyltransferase complex protein AlgI
MAIGLGHIFGFNFLENFNYPYTAQSITDFWRRWHMSLSTWFRDYVYIPLGGSRVKLPRHIFNILVVWLLTGFWHGAGWNFMAWGVYFGLILLFEKFVFGRALKKCPRFIRHVYVILAICVGWVFFDAPSFGAVGQTLGQMFGFTASGLAGKESLYYLWSYALPLLFALIGCVQLPKRLFNRFENKKAMTIIEPIVIALLLIIVTAFLVDGSFNPFIYYRF